jgi:hypothetical protein
MNAIVWLLFGGFCPGGGTEGIGVTVTAAC